MSNLFEKIGSVIVSVGLTIGGFFGYTLEPEVAYVPQAVYVPQEEESLGADTVLPIAGMTYYLAGTGISSSASSFTLTSFTITQNGKKITDSEMSETFYFTLEPGSRARQEIVACTTVVQNADGTATISGCTRGMSPVTPYTASSSLAFAHAGGSIAIISNPPQLYNQVAIKDNDEAITGYWDFPAPVGGNNPATKDYVDGVVTGGTLTYDATVIAGIAGDTFATGTVVYLNPTDARWEKADVDLDSTFVNRTLGIAQGSGSDGVSINGGVLTYGIDETQIGMTPGAMQFLSSTAGGTTTATTSQVLGVARGATELMFDPNVLRKSFYGTTTIYGTTTFSGGIEGLFTRSSTTYFYGTTSTSTYIKPAGLLFVEVEVLGGGGVGGPSYSGEPGTGGGGGGYIRKIIPAEALTATTGVKVGIGGTGGVLCGSNFNSGDPGGASVFQGHLVATGGRPGANVNSDGNGGGSGGLGYPGGIKYPGGTANDLLYASTYILAGYGGRGGDSPYGTGGSAPGISVDQVGSNASGYGAGGGGAFDSSASCSSGQYGGAGTQGLVIVHEYF